MSLFSRLSRVSRVRKLEMFKRLMKPAPESRVLNVGAEADPSGSRGLELLDFYPWKNKLSAINLSTEHIALIKRLYPEVKAVVGDACQAREIGPCLGTLPLARSKENRTAIYTGCV